MTDLIATIPVKVTYVTEQKIDVDAMMLDYMETEYRALLMKVRDLEKHLMMAGRISRSQLRPVRDR